VEEFYQGTVAKQIDSDMRENGGLLRYDDLALIPYPIVRKPLRRKFRGLTVYSMPPPGAGRSLLFTLSMINMIKPRHLNRDEFDRAHLLVEIFRNTLLERSDRPFDPNYYPQVAEQDMLKRTYVRRCIREITRETEIRIPIRETEDEISGETTHLSVIDSSGMAVSLTQSIERTYGSKAAADGLGFLYNNYLMDYDYKVFSHPFYLRPNAVPWATVAPTLIFRGKKVWMAVGSPGSERIFSVIAQFLIHVVDEHQSICEAMYAPRLHCSLGGRVSLEAGRFPDRFPAFFQQKGYGMPVRGRGPATCPPEWIRALAESLRLAFAGEGGVAMNDPFAGGYISRYHYERSGIPWIQIEINRKLYLNETYFDPERLRVDQRIIRKLRERISDAIVRFLTVL
jgi:gamma-glutamyltranspeptidase/glutathione hydrolase